MSWFASILGEDEPDEATKPSAGLTKKTASAVEENVAPMDNTSTDGGIWSFASSLAATLKETGSQFVQDLREESKELIEELGVASEVCLSRLKFRSIFPFRNDLHRDPV